MDDGHDGRPAAEAARPAALPPRAIPFRGSRWLPAGLGWFSAGRFCLAGSLLAAGCGGASPDGPGRATVLDSAGVEIVTNAEGSVEAAPTWSLSMEPELEIGAGASPDVVLHRVVDLVPLGKGRVAVATNDPPQVLLLAEDGERLATLGREGEGPGEFSSVASILPLEDDSIAVWDDWRRRVSVFTPDGRLRREVDLSQRAPLTPVSAPNMSTWAAFTYLLPSAPGSMVLFTVGYFGPGEGMRRIATPSWRLSTAGQELAVYGPFPGGQTFVSPTTGLVPVAFGAVTDGVTSGDALVVGTAESAEIRVHGPEGSLRRIVRWPDRPRAVGGPLLEAWNHFVDDWLAPMPTEQRALFRDVFDATPPVERFPAYDGLVAGDSGRVWVGDYAGQLSMPGTPLDARVPARSWLVLDESGVVAATVPTPPGFQPGRVRDHRVWGVFTDELDVESVRAYRLERTAR